MQTKTNFKDPLTFFTTLGPPPRIYQRYQFKNKFIFQGSGVLRCTTASCAGPRLRPTRPWASPARSPCTRSRRTETTRFPAKVGNDDRTSWKTFKSKTQGEGGQDEVIDHLRWAPDGLFQKCWLFISSYLWKSRGRV